MVYVFDDCELDTQRIALRRAGQTLSLRPKVFQALVYLLTHRERVVDKQELCAQVWPAQFISDATLAIPTTLHDSLMARLDRLGAAKSVAQLGATGGRRFPYALLHAVAQRDDLHLQQALVQLVEAEMVY